MGVKYRAEGALGAPQAPTHLHCSLANTKCVVANIMRGVADILHGSADISCSMASILSNVPDILHVQHQFSEIISIFLINELIN